MLYNNGTIAINGNTATGTSTNWTAPASQVRAGQTIIVMSNPVQLFQISSVNSATSLTITPAASPALSGQKYGILVSDIISVDGLAQAMSQLIKEYDENIGAWETFATTSANQNITVTINGAAVNIPGIGGLARKGSNSDITELKGLSTALSITQGGTGAKDASQGWANLLNGRTPATARSDLQLSAAATAPVQTSIDDSTAGALLTVGAFGLGGITGMQAPTNANLINKNGIWNGGSAGSTNYFDPYSPLFCMFRTATTSSQLQATIDGRLAVRGYNGSTMSAWNQCYTTGNTTRAADGTIKAASPIVRIVKSKEDCTRPDIDEADFEWCGAGVANGEAEGVTLTREATGVYLLKGSAGLAKSGWQMSPPRDPQGSGDMGIVEAEQAEDGSLIIRLYKRRYVLSDDGDIELQKGVAIDVPPTSWIDVRLDMPENSIWNQRAKSAQEE